MTGAQQSVSVWQGQGRRVFMQEVGPRDGLQMENAFVPTADKIALVDALSDTGVAKIEVSAFVSARAIPALRDAEAVLGAIRRRPGVVYAALVPNARGAERAIEAACDELNLVMSVTETHNLSNLRMTPEQSLRALGEVVAMTRGTPTSVSIALSCAFGCSIEGDVPADSVMAWVGRFVEELGVRSVTLCDTAGMAHPGQVATLVRRVRARWPWIEWTMHFHDTRGMGLANVLAAIDAGADRFDASIGGLGGCPSPPAQRCWRRVC
jgi:hydroxymethylglutaryl-CoA lyase